MKKHGCELRIGVLGTAISLSALLGCSTQQAPSERSIPLTEAQKHAIWSLTCCAENSQTNFAFDYAENIGDGRGITFGIIGFTSGTYDGTMLLERVNELDPRNPLVAYLPAFKTIDALPHDADGCCDSTQDLSGFIESFEAHGEDPAVKQAQLEKLTSLYWEPALRQAERLGITTAIAVGELYDACVNHGEDGNEEAVGLKQLIEKANAAAGGSPRSGLDEKAWLRAFLQARREYIERDWPDAVDRIDMYSRILDSGNTQLEVPFTATCYGDTFTITGARP
jgi:chitosanase